jgi:hypothetical protein
MQMTVHMLTCAYVVRQPTRHGVEALRRHIDADQGTNTIADQLIESIAACTM